MLNPTDSTNNDYDAVPYQSNPYRHTHPDNLCAVGRLFGMSPAEPTQCRVLELGCASGGNLAPMAEQLPTSRFVGIDLSSRQISEGKEMFSALGLKNLALENCDIMDVGAALGAFDYIICHGVYSWVPRTVQEKILTICRDLLAPQGIAFISFNTYPGWHMRENVRHMMRYHAARFEAPEKRIEQSLALINFLVEQFKDESDPYAALLSRELHQLNDRGDFYLFHEHLEEVNTPCYFHEFAAALNSCNLQYLGDAEASSMLGQGLREETRDALRRVANDLIQMEQYMDFVRNRTFRMALVCKEDVALQRDLNLESLKDLRCEFRLKEGQSIERTASTETSVLESHQGLNVTTSSPPVKTALKYLHESWPKSVPIETLMAVVKQTLDENALSFDDVQKRGLAVDLMHMIEAGAMAIHTFDPVFVTTMPERPKIRPCALVSIGRYAFATSARHGLVTMTDAVAKLAGRMDGSHTLENLLEQMVTLARQGEIKVMRDEEAIREGHDIQQHLERFVHNTARQLLDSFLFVPD